ncbi:hypothetical protein TRFO_21831 [Tritrichomonas foetus]|uniref:Importin N-terminal domain-containing protein n=1 Tax=Tritrichomonas foetus TaxID=1144522 RepID=A0A1J4KHM3_9EUKA|nr:hypothetical protein TRFO_21831 [Tritrichomonas foetus]|eukprot:OHT09332.1 hypothetical protein TRFO_21831 [Tritrichomonas foetus]
MSEGYEQVVQLFIDLLDINESTRTRASDLILDMFTNNIVFLIQCCADIIVSDSVPVVAQQQSFITLMRAFRPTTEMPFSVVEKNYFSLSEQIRFNIRSAIIRGLLFPQPNIYQPAAFLVALIVMIDKKCSADILNYLRTVSISSEFPKTAHFAAILAYKEIYISGLINSLLNFPNEQFRNQISEILHQELNDFHLFINSAALYPVEFILEVILTLKEFIRCNPSLFENIEEQNSLISSIESLLPIVQDENLYRAIFHLLFALLDVLYDSGTLNLPRLIEITTKGIICGRKDFVSISIDFWNEVLIKEREIVYLQEKYDRYLHYYKDRSHEYRNHVLTKPIYQNYSVIFASNSINTILNALTQIEENDACISDRSIKKVYMYAAEFLKKLFPLSPKEVFPILTSFIFSFVTKENLMNINDEVFNAIPWTIKCSILYAISSMCTNRQFPGISDFFRKITNFVVKCSLSEIERLAELSLYTLKSIQQSCFIYSYESDFNQFIPLLNFQMKRSPFIITRTLEFIQQLFKAPNAPLHLFFVQFFEILSIPLTCENRYVDNMLNITFNTFNTLVCQCNNHSKEYIISLLKSCLSAIQKELSSFEPEEPIVKSLIHLIGLIFKNFPDLNEEAKIAFQFINEIMKVITYAEDALLALTHIIPSLNEDVAQYLPFIMQHIENAMNSGSPDIIKNAVICITNLFKYETRLMMSFLNPTINLVLVTLNNKTFMPDFYPEVALKLSMIIEFVYLSKFTITNDCRDRIMEIYQKMSTLPLEFDSPNGIAFVNSVIECVLLGYSKIIFISQSDKEFLVRNKKIFYLPVLVFRKLKIFTDKLLLAFVDLIYSSCKYMPKETNVFYHKQFHTNILFHAMSSYDSNLSDKAIAVYDIYRNS